MESRTSDLRVAVLQDGARLHYAIPVALHRQGALERVFCDWYSGPGSLMRATAKLIKLRNQLQGERMLARYTPDLQGARIITNPQLLRRTRKARGDFKTQWEFFEWESRQYAQWVQQIGLGDARAFFGFIRNAHPDLFAWAKANGINTVGDQIIAPYAIEHAEELKQRERFPDFAKENLADNPGGLADLERRTWANLDRITCASDYVRHGLLAQNVPQEKIIINPYPVDATHFPLVDRRGRKGPVVVGFLGAVGLRKGAPYFFQVAQHFDPAKVRFIMVGPVGIAEAAIRQHAGHVEFAGPQPRSSIARWLERFDIYFFPSTCEGSAGSIVEAMSSGLPVVTTPNSGSLVDPGISGHILPYDDIAGFVKAIEQLAANEDQRLAMGRAARAKVESLGLDVYGKILAETFRSLS